MNAQENIIKYIIRCLIKVKQPIEVINSLKDFTKIATFNYSNISVTILYRSQQELKKFSKIIKTFAPWANSVSVKFNTKKLHFILIDLLGPKEFPRNLDFLHRKYVQTATTKVEPYLDRVLIYRLEELSKILIHEVIHHTKFDSFENYNSSTQDIVFESLNYIGIHNFNCMNCITVNEAVVELWSIIIHSWYYSKYYKLDFDTVLYFEIINGWTTTGMLCNYFKSAPGTDSYMISYLLLRTALLENYKKFDVFTRLQSGTLTQLTSPESVQNIINNTLKNKNFLKKLYNFSNITHENTFRLSVFSYP